MVNYFFNTWHNQLKIIATIPTWCGISSKHVLCPTKPCWTYAENIPGCLWYFGKYILCCINPCIAAVIFYFLDGIKACISRNHHGRLWWKIRKKGKTTHVRTLGVPYSSPCHISKVIFAWRAHNWRRMLTREIWVRREFLVSAAFLLCWASRRPPCICSRPSWIDDATSTSLEVMRCINDSNNQESDMAEWTRRSKKKVLNQGARNSGA